jgi:lipopolysaccharide/colanic/teichoic acid biosynthesis glycosyltransferase
LFFSLLILSRPPAGRCWAQVNGLRGNTSIEDRVNLDNYYIDNWSLWNDVKILIRTLPTLFRRAFASPAGVSVDNTELDPAAQARSRTR